MKLKKMIFVLFTALLTCSCATSCSLREAAYNRQNISKLRIGMTRDQVREIMGEPLSGEKYAADDAWFYFTYPKWFDGMNTRDECTPLMFDELGTLRGIGYEYYKDALNKKPEDRSRLDVQL